MINRTILTNLWFNKRGRGYLLQLLVLLGVTTLLAIITSNTIAPSESRTYIWLWISRRSSIFRY